MELLLKELKASYDTLDKICGLQDLEADGGGFPVVKVTGLRAADFTAVILSMKRALAASKAEPTAK